MTAAVYDVLIGVFLVVDGIFLFRVFRAWFREPRKTIRIRILPFAVIILLALSWLVVFYGSFIEPRLIVVNEQTVVLSDKPTESLRVALISDLHVGPYKKDGFVTRVVDRVMELKPDVILIGGDNVFDADAHVRYLSPLKNLSAPKGVFAVLGNHDYGEDYYFVGDKKAESRALLVRTALESAGVKVLTNEGKRIKAKNKTLYLLGLDDFYTDRGSISASLRTLGLSRMPHPSVVFAHNPDFLTQAVREGADALLASHTHGGQIRLPLIGSVPEIPTRLGRDFDRGLFKVDGTQMFITSGVGESGPRARLFVPPEIAMLTIKF